MESPERRAGPVQGVLLLLPITMAVMGLVVLVPVLPGMMAEYRDVPGVDYLVPLTLTLPALCVALLSPVAGLVVDGIGRRRTLIAALAGYAVVGMLPMALTSLSAIIASRVVLGALEALVVIASTTLIGDYFHGREREKWLANQAAVGSISSILLAFLGGVLGGFGWRGAFAAYGVSILFAAALFVWTWEPRRAEQPRDAVAAPAAAFPWRAILPVALLAVFGGTMFFAMQIEVSTVLSDGYGIRAPGTLGLFSALAGLAVAAGTLAYRQVTARRAVATQLLVAFGLLGIAYVMMGHAATPASFTAWLVANQLGAGMLLPSLVVLAMAALPFEVRGRGTGLFMSGWWLGQPLSTQVVALLRGANGGDPRAALPVLGMLCLVAAAIALAGRLRGGRAAVPAI